jgi:hypothetical protein
MNPTVGMRSSDESSTSLSYSCTKAPRSGFQPRVITWSYTASRALAHLSNDPGRPSAVDSLIARSNAVQLMTLPQVKFLRPPRVSQMSSSGWSQLSLSQSSMSRTASQPLWPMLRPLWSPR